MRTDDSEKHDYTSDAGENGWFLAGMLAIGFAVIAVWLYSGIFGSGSDTGAELRLRDTLMQRR